VRILHVLDHSIPLQSGYTFRTLAILREQRRLGWQTFHLTTPKHIGARADEEDVDGWRFVRTRGSGLRVPVLRELALMWRVERRLEEVVARVVPDILHVHSPVLNAIPALRVGRRRRIPVVYEVRALWEDAGVDHGTHREWGVRYRTTRALESSALRRADHVTTICEGLRNDIIARGIPAERVTVIPNAVDPSIFEADVSPDLGLKARLGLAGKTIVGFIGSFYGYEGLDLLVRALPSMLRHRPEVRVLLVGGGPEESRIRRLADASGLTDKSVFVGRVPHGDVHRYYSIVDVFAYPRRSLRITELVTPLKPLEAMAQGRLVVASDVGGHRELIRDYETGILFAADDPDALAAAVVNALDDSAQAQEIRVQARRFVECERNWQASVRGYRPVFERLSRESSHTPGFALP
jgi:PEP-CTERM/exosortase A-associated glycosyltransferase